MILLSYIQDKEVKYLSVLRASLVSRKENGKLHWAKPYHRVSSDSSINLHLFVVFFFKFRGRNLFSSKLLKVQYFLFYLVLFRIAIETKDNHFSSSFGHVKIIMRRTPCIFSFLSYNLSS